jgi:hypothetical protein
MSSSGNQSKGSAGDYFLRLGHHLPSDGEQRFEIGQPNIRRTIG